MNEPLTQNEKNRIFMTLDAQTKILEKLERGMYGDKENKFLGALDDIKLIQGEIKNIKSWIEKSKRKIAYIAGIGTAIGLAFNKAWEWIIAHVK